MPASGANMDQIPARTCAVVKFYCGDIHGRGAARPAYSDSTAANTSRAVSCCWAAQACGSWPIRADWVLRGACLSHCCELSISRTPWNFFKLVTNVHLDSRRTGLILVTINQGSRLLWPQVHPTLINIISEEHLEGLFSNLVQNPFGLGDNSLELGCQSQGFFP